MDKQLTIKTYNEYFGEEIDNLNQLKSQVFSGEDLHEFLELFLELSFPTEEEIQIEMDSYIHLPAGFINGIIFVKSKYEK